VVSLEYPLQYNTSWLFKPLNVQEKLPYTFYKEVRILLNQNDNSWWKLLSERSNIGHLTKVYDVYIGKRRRNAHSLLLRHEPEQYGWLTPGNYRRRYLKKRCIECLKMCCNNHKCCDNSATVLLGDLELDGKARDVLERHKFICPKAGTVLIPHHGADSDDLLWLDGKAHYHCGCSTLVVSYGTKNTFGHPCFIYDGAMADIKNHVAFVNENNEYRYEIFVRD
jgi:hypothetical protein